MSYKLRAKIATLLKKIIAQLWLSLIDISGLAGVALIAYGARLIYLPLGYIVLGGFLVVIAWLLGRGAN